VFEVFISYARSTTEREAIQIEEALRALGYSVWRDNLIPAHRLYGDVLDERLKAAKAVVVVWSAAAAKSPWVRSEAENARVDGKLIQLTVDGARLPMPFDQIECANLVGWSGEAEAPAWRKVVGSVVDLAGKAIESEPAQVPEQGPSVCVTAFANMSDDPEQEYFSDGISEDIITDLSKVAALFVVARTSAFALKGKVADAREAARRFGVRHVLTGSVRKAGGRVRISAQLIDGATGGQVWAERYDRDLQDIFALQDEISHAIVDALKVRLLPEESRSIAQRGTDNVEAYDLLLMARQAYVNGDQGDPRWTESIIRLCRRATEIDPNYAQAWAYLALGQVAAAYTHGETSADATAAAERALALNPNLAEAHTVRARIHSDAGDHEDAAREIEIALHIDPQSWLAAYTAGLVYLASQAPQEAIRHYEAAQALDDTDIVSPQMLMSCYEALGDRSGVLRAAGLAITHVEAALARDRNNAFAIAIGADALAVLGQFARAKEQMQRALLTDPDNIVVQANVAGTLAARFGELDAALDMLASALPRMGRGLFDLVTRSRKLDPVRDDPRFRSMMADAQARLAAQAGR